MATVARSANPVYSLLEPTISSAVQRRNAKSMSKKGAEETATALEGLIEAAQARGLRINNFDQLEDGWPAPMSTMENSFTYPRVHVLVGPPPSKKGTGP